MGSGSGAHDHTAMPCKEWPLRKLHYNESMTMLLYKNLVESGRRIGSMIIVKKLFCRA